jgi:integrase
MPKLKITEKTLAKIKAPDPSGRQTAHWDTALKGFGVLCSGKTNTKTYVAQREFKGGRTRRVTIARTNEIDLTEARKRAADVLDDMRRGIDPKNKVEKITLTDALDNYLAARKDLRPASIRVYRTSVNVYLHSWTDLPLKDITGDMIETRHRAIANEVGKGQPHKGEVTANLAMRTLRLLWINAAERFPDLPPHPVKRLRRQWYPEQRRTRLVKAEELPKFYNAVVGLTNHVARDYLLLLLFTGLRLSESNSLTWNDIDFVQRVIRVPASRTKAGRKLDLPMNDFVRDLLVARRSLGDAKYVFPGPGKSGHLTNTTWPLAHVAEACGVLVSAHDLRRTFVTVAEACDISPIALKALVNHSVGDVTSGYAIMSVERLREAAQRVADQMKSMCGIAAPAVNVSRLHK